MGCSGKNGGGGRNVGVGSFVFFLTTIKPHRLSSNEFFFNKFQLKRRV